MHALSRGMFGALRGKETFKNGIRMGVGAAWWFGLPTHFHNAVAANVSLRNSFGFHLIQIGLNSVVYNSLASSLWNK
jgi:hypothetical protein